MEPYVISEEVRQYLPPGRTMDGLRQPLYDAQRFTANIAAGTEIQFFATPIGQGTGIGGGAKTALDTNMRLAGQLPAGHVFECWSPRIVVGFDDVASANLPAVNQQADILNDILYGSFFTFRIVSQLKLECPAFFLPAGAGPVASFQGFQGAAANFQAAIVTNGSPDQTAPTVLHPFPVVIPPTQQFTVSLTAVRQVTFSAAVGGILIWVVLDGILHRVALP